MSAHRTHFPESYYKLTDEFDRFLSNPMETAFKTMKKMDNMMRLMDRDFLGGSISGLQPASYFMDLDFVDDGNVYRINFDIPGVEKDNIQLEITDNNALKVTVDRKSKNVENKKNFVKKERSYGKFTREIPLPDDSDVDSIKAEYQNGVLEITLDKLQQKQKTSKKIFIK